MADYKGRIGHTGTQVVKAPYGGEDKKGKSSVKRDSEARKDIPGR